MGVHVIVMSSRARAGRQRLARLGVVSLAAALVVHLAAVSPAIGQTGGCEQHYRWAETNTFKPPTLVPGFNMDEDIAAGAFVSVYGVGRMREIASQIFVYGTGLARTTEHGAKIYIENNHENPDDARVFEMRALIHYPGPNTSYQALIREVNPDGHTSGDDVNSEMQILAGPVPFDENPQAPEFYWAKATIDVGHELATGEYYFCMRFVCEPQDVYRGYYWVAVERVGAMEGYWTPGGLDYGLWHTGATAGDPMIVVRKCDPTPTNQPPVAVAEVIGDTTVQTGETVSFDGSQSYDPDPGDDITYDWDFGDDTGSEEISPSHAYDQAGDYTVTLVVEDTWGATDEDNSITIHVIEASPPSIDEIQIERLTGPGAPADTEGVHTGDETTRLRFSATVTGGDGEPCDCTYEWSDRDGIIPEEYTDDMPLVGTAPELGMTALGWHRITLTATDQDTGLESSRSVDFYVSELPRLELSNGPPLWGPAPDEGLAQFEYLIKVSATVHVADVPLTNEGRVELTDLDGVPLDEDPVWISSYYDPPGLDENRSYVVPGLRLDKPYRWDPYNCDRGNISLGTEENFDIQAVDLTDRNGYTLPRIRSFNPREGMAVDVPKEKIDAYGDARWNYESGVSAQDAALISSAAAVTWTALGFAGCDGPCWAAAAAETAAAVAFEAAALHHFRMHNEKCPIAHDPIVPDPDFVTTVPLIIEEPPGSSACSLDEGPDEMLRAAEANATWTGAFLAYGASLNKLAGVYTFVDPVGDPETFMQFSLLQGTEVVRYGQILADGLGRSQAAWCEAVAVVPVTAEEIEDAQRWVMEEGFPELLRTQLELWGVDIGDFTTTFLAADPYVVAEHWAAGPPDVYDALAAMYLSQSYFVVPTRVVLVGVTQPLMDTAVTGLITIDARVVHKKEMYDDLVCGDTVVTEVYVDDELVAQVPPPVPGETPAPSAVPVEYDTSGLPDGVHTITVLARDGCEPQPGQEIYHRNTDAITFTVDHTPPTIEITSPDADPETPGIQVMVGDLITYEASDDGSGVVGPTVGYQATIGGLVTQSLCIADRAGNIATAEVDVLRPVLDNGIIRADFTEWGTSGDRFPHASAISADIAWLPVSQITQVYSWEGNLHYDDFSGGGPANHLLADPNEFAIIQTLRPEGEALVSRMRNDEFRVVARHFLEGTTLTTHLEITNISGVELPGVNVAWMLDADLVPADNDPREPCCNNFPWLGFGAGRWFGDAGEGLQTNVNHCAGIVPAEVSVAHAARLDGLEVPLAWSVGNPSGFQGATCAFNGPVEGEPRYLFEQSFDDTEGWVGFDQDLGVVTNFVVPSWPVGVMHTFAYTLTFRRPGDVDADGVIDFTDFGAVENCWNGPDVGPLIVGCAALDSDYDDDVDLHDFSAFQAAFGGQ
jgi:PKD repeat protein